MLSKTLQLFSSHTEAALQAAREDEAQMIQGQYHDTEIVKEVDSGRSEMDTGIPAVRSSDSLEGREVAELLDEDTEHEGKLNTAESASSLEQELAPAGDKPPTGLPYPPCAPTGWRWVVLDGPVDPGWVENLNSTLDDSKVLCLANGERVELLSGMRILFETDDLSNASPATISRCGMIYVVGVFSACGMYTRFKVCLVDFLQNL